MVVRSPSVDRLHAATLEPMTLEEFRNRSILQVLTADEAIAMFNDMRDKAPVEHFTMMLPPGIRQRGSTRVPSDVYADSRDGVFDPNSAN